MTCGGTGFGTAIGAEWAPDGIRVNGLVPGLFPQQDEAAQIVGGVPDRGKNEGARQPVGRVGRPRELGCAATFACSPYASFATGCTLVLDSANWQRRAMFQPEFTPIREQLGKGPFKP